MLLKLPLFNAIVKAWPLSKWGREGRGIFVKHPERVGPVKGSGLRNLQKGGLHF